MENGRKNLSFKRRAFFFSKKLLKISRKNRKQNILTQNQNIPKFVFLEKNLLEMKLDGGKFSFSRVFLKEIDFGEISYKIRKTFEHTLAKNYLIENILIKSFFTRRIIFKIRRKQFLNYIENNYIELLR